MRPPPLILVGLLMATVLDAQILRLTEHGSGLDEVEAVPGDTVEIAVNAELGRFMASGLTLFVHVPQGFEVVEESSPFVPGSLFEGAVVVRNGVVRENLPQADWQLLEYAAILGPATTRTRSGSGLVACFRLRCLYTVATAIELHHSPVHESRLVLDDGRGERPFLVAPPMQVTVDDITAVESTTWGQLKTPR